MISTSFLGLFQNAACLLAAAFIFDLIASQWRTQKPLFRQVSLGIAVGVIGIVVMMTPWEFIPGIVFDTRSVLIGISGLFFGSVPAAIAMGMTALFRYYQGGAGAWTGISVIVASGVIGIAWRRLLRRPLSELSWWEIYLFGLVIHVVMLGLMLTLPWATALRVIANISLPVLVIYPLGTALLGMLVVNRLQHENTEDRLRESRQQYRDLVKSISDLMWEVDQNACYTYVSPKIRDILGYEPEEIIGKTPFDFMDEHERKRVAGIFATLVDSRGPVQAFENIVLHKNGEKVIFETSGVPVFDDRGGLRGYRGIDRDITERKRAEELLHEREQMLRAIIHGSPIPQFVIDNDHRVVFWNQALTKYTGISAEEMVGTRDHWKAFYREQRPCMADVLVDGDISLLPSLYPGKYSESKLVAGAYEATDHFLLFGKEPTWLHFTAAPIREPDGSIIGAVETLVDITDLKCAEEALRQSGWEKTVLNQIVTIFLTIPDDHMYREVLTVVRHAMGSRFGIFGYVSDDGDLVIPSLTSDVWGECQVLDKSIIFPPETWGDSLWGKAIREKRSFSSDGPFHTPEGHIRIDNFLSIPIIFGNKTIGLLSVANNEKGYGEQDKIFLENIAKNISPILNARLQRDRQENDRKRAEKALEESEGKYRGLFENAIMGIFQTSPEGRYLSINPAGARMAGFDSPEEMAKSVANLAGQIYVNPDDRERLRNILESQGVVEKFEVELYRKDRSKVWVSINGRAVRDDEGRILYYETTHEDITERRNLQAQLLQSQKMEAIGTLSGGIAHDFNNILMAIMGYTGLIGMKVQHDPELTSYINQVQGCTSRAANLTRGLLAFSRKQAVELQPQSMNMILRDCEKLLQRLVPEDVEFSLSLDDDVIIMADMTQIDQVLINLVSNAKDAMPKGGALRVKAKAVQLGREFRQAQGFGEPGAYACISVTDTGIGMDEATQKKIFEPFFTTKEIGKGTGLGLSIVYGIIKQHSGYITVSSEQGRGTTFDIYLPVVNAAITETPEVSVDVPRGTETVLVAEDDATLREIAKETLCTYGYNVIEAGDGEDAVNKYMEHGDKIDLLIFDVVMPKKNGKEAYDDIRKIKPTIKVVFVSGYTGDVVLDKGIQDTSVCYISKPLSPHDLLKKVREVLDRSDKPVF